MSKPSDPSREQMRARALALRLLKIRNRSEQEIRDRLKRKEFSPALIEETTRYLKEIHLLDDEQFARWWISCRLKKPLGFRKIRMELRLKGVAPEIIESECEKAGHGSSEKDRIRMLAQKRMDAYRNLEPLKAKKRLSDYLLWRGFSYSDINDILKEYDCSRNQK